MELKSGYKQTEVGVIPGGWKVIHLGKLLNETPSYGINAAAIPHDSRFPTYIRITDITEDGKYSHESSASVSHPDSLNYTLSNGDLVFARTGASVGKSYLYDKRDGELVYAGFLIRIKPSEDLLSSYYLKYVVQTKSYWTWIRLNSQRSGQPGINGKQLAALPLPLPPTKAEQEAIAGALSDADELIASLEQLIEKKRMIKQGAMQELLTGKKRLPGFQQKWVIRKLGDLANLSKVGINPILNPESIYTHFSLPSFDSGEIPVTEKGSSIGSNKFVVFPNSVLISKLNPRIPRIWAPDHIPSNAVCSTEFLVLIPKPDTDRLFLSVICKSPIVSYQMELHATGTTGSHQRISPSQVMSIEVEIPFEQAEALAISTIISDMDTEIEALENKLEKARKIKAGMMHNLITGTIRLV